ncbi:polyketide synthase [Trichoderma arundinaceum]|uniref:Polyketide synthase n=1 Tax=Trichoderma arundinaceum TaxID=490622 RepID=A0A395NR65_TRIAR|nr:polyketide synthase [Trichoderma arundinaceum]
MTLGLLAVDLSEGSSSPDYSSSGVASPLRHSEPIAICGFASRLPGDSSTPQKFWDLLANGRTGQCDVPKSRFNVDGFYHPKGMDRPGSVVTKGGYFLKEDIREFENSFFGINNLEATYMDPQQRKLLEVVFECFENAGVPLEKASGSNTGCYVGNFTFDFITMQTKDPDYMSRYSATGLGTTILANRISHVFNLLGPSFVLDTACSSSLYCLHQACVALENYECDAAIVAGANLIQSAEQHIATMKVGVLSETSACHSFDTSADGYGRADGIGALYVKRLKDALRDGDPIRSIVRGSALNANGKTAGISLPSADGQEAVIRKAMAKAGLHPDEITYVECHGTGTKVGDAIEVDALARVFRRSEKNPLLIGAVKSSIGHSEAASGISGVIKATLALEHGEIPPTYGLQNINPKLKLEERHIQIPTELTPWPKTSPFNIRRAGINSFGYGGANAHVVLEQAPKRPSQPEARELIVSQSSVVLPLSAATSSSLEARVEDLANFDFGSIDILDLCYTLGSRRTQFPNRGFLIAPRSETIANTFKNRTLVTAANPVTAASAPFAFVFTGQGSQWAGMCCELFSEFPVFRDVISEMDAVLQALPEAPEWTLKDAILNTDDTGLINLPERSQPCCTAIQVALVRLLASWGISPSMTVGHSSGEIAAAFAAGHLSVAEAIVVAYYRGYCVAKAVQKDGAMMAVGLSEEAASEAIHNNGFEGQIRVACVNSPEGTTISGDRVAIDSFYEILNANGTFARKLKTGGQAYHSHHMLAIGDEYQTLLDNTLRTLEVSSRLPKGASMMSSVTVELKSSGFDGAYWRSNLEGQVRFAQAIAAIYKVSEHCFIELGPHSSLELPVKQTLGKAGVAAADVKYVAPIKRNTNALESGLTFAGSLWLKGYDIAWSKVNGLETSLKSSQSLFHVVTDLPKYRFSYEEILWAECRASIEYRLRKYPRHELLGSLMPGGNGKDFIFRNILKVDEVAWLKDHQLGDTVVFPGAGYMVMAMEAVSQIVDVDRAIYKPTFRFSNLNITSALALSTENTSQVEVFTSMHQSTITNASTSSTWWDFNVSSYVEGTSVSHITGSIAIDMNTITLETKYEPPSGSLESSAKRTWYEKFVRSGLNYGPTFQAISEFQTPRMKGDTFCSATGPLLTSYGDPLSVYPIHPITLDAMIQLAIVATTKGVPKELIALVPTRLASAVIKTSTDYSDQDCRMNSTVQKTGFGYSTGGVEIVTKDSEVVAQFDNLRLAPYQSGSQQEEDRRHPVLRILWKPDVYGLDFMTSKDMEIHAQKFADEANSPVSDDGLLKMGAILDLLVHKNPVLRILELDNDSHELTTAILELLSYQTDFKRLSSYTTASFAQDGALLGGLVDFETGERSVKSSEIEGQFDLLLIPKARKFSKHDLDLIDSLMSEDSSILGIFPDGTHEILSSADLNVLSCPVSQGQSTLVVARQPPRPNQEALKKNKFLIVEREESKLGHALSNALSAIHEGSVMTVKLQDLSPEHVSTNPSVFSLVEVKDPLLSVISDDEMRHVKMMTDGAANLVWVTNGNLMHGDRPDFALIQGLARALILEQPSLKIFTYDIDDSDTDVDVSAQRLINVLNQRSRKPDLEFAQRKGTVHVGRMVPDEPINATFRSKQGLETTPAALKDINDARLIIEHAGQFDTIFFKQQEPPKTIAATEVRIKVASVGLNAKDYYVLAGRVDTPDATCQLECAGTVVQVGSEVTSLAVGDRVVAMAPTHFQTYQTLPEFACCKLTEKENFDVVSTLPLVYATAIYALHYRANIRAGESILIHSGAGGVGMAAIQLAQQAGAEVFTTVSTEEKKSFLAEKFGIKPANIFSSRDTSFLDGILKATSGRGVDVIINSLTGDQLHATWRCAASFGRFVEIGKLDLTTAGRLEMDQFLKNTTFTAFDLSHLYHSNNEQYHAVWKQLLSEVMSLYRQNRIAAFEPLKIFDVAEAPQAFRYFASRSRMGKIAINLENSDATVNVHKLKHTTWFDSDKSYVMVGCLGGLGRTLSRWMVSRGAKKFAFLGRSGLAKAAARNLVEDLEASGATCVVVKGDVCSAADVEAVTAAAAQMGAIGGVVQAAMGLNEALFSVMPNNYWHTGIDPKVHGTWHLYNSLRVEGRDSSLDFFLMTSSVSGSVGTATESNYCSGNHFLDHFARFMRNKGLPAVSVGLGMISEVGYLHENPEIEAILLRKGIQAIDADELIQLIDLALSSSTTMGIHHAHDDLAAAHLLTGLEAFGLKELRKKGFEGSYPALDDPRANLLASALDGDAANQWQSQDGNLPVEVTKLMEAGQTLAEAVLDHIRKRFGNLILMKMEAVDPKKPLSAYGMDSMIGAEFRSWFYQSMVVDVPLVLLLSKTCTLETLRDLAVKTLENN